MLKRISLKSKLILMLLSIALICIVVVGYQGLKNGEKTLEARIYEQLTSVRESKLAQINAWYEDTQDQVRFMAIDHTFIRATREFSSAYARLQDATLSPEQQDSLRSFYQDQYLPKLESDLKIRPDIEHYLPTEPAEQYLQYHYISNNPGKAEDKAEMNASPDDTSYYSGVHRHYHSVFRKVVESFEFDDMFLVDIKDGNIIYSVNKKIDFATNLYLGKSGASNLGKLAKTIRDKQDKDYISIVDFDFYKPSYGLPSAFLGTTIFDEQKKAIGILIVQVSSAHIDKIMTGNFGWEKQGLGNTGEAFLVGNDMLVRSNVRPQFDSEGCYAEALEQKDLLDKKTADRICHLKTSVLLQKVSNTAVRDALEGDAGTLEIKSYTGNRALVAYAPIYIGKMRWGIVAQFDLEEANAPIYEFQKELGVSAVIIASIVTFIAMLLAYIFTRPISELMKGVRQLEDGETRVHIDLNRSDEYGELAKTLNNTAELLYTKDKLLKEKQNSYMNLLGAILPEKVANSYLNNNKRFAAERVENVSVIYTALKGFSDYQEHEDPAATINLLHQLIEEIDILAEEHGLEKIKTFGENYFAACGLTVPRLNHAQRCYEFSKALLETVQLFNHRHAVNFSMRIGVDSGAVLMGIVGNDKFSFDVWGKPVVRVTRIRFEVPENSIAVTQETAEKLLERDEFQDKRVIETKTMGSLPIYVYTLPKE